MQNIIQMMSLLAGSQLMRKSMSTNLDIHFTHKPIRLDFDRDKKYCLYIHIPFCHEFCTFCSFHKFKYETHTCKEYFQSLRAELRKVKNEGLNFDKLYIGGGTPLIDEAELLSTIELAKKLFDLREVSCESTPNHINPKMLVNFKGLIDRLSVGVQTFNDTILKQIARYEKYGSSEILQERISLAIGILPIMSLDLIFNLKNQTKDMLRYDLDIVKKLGAEQITTYPFINSHLTKQSLLQNYYALRNTQEFEFYNIIREELKEYSLNNAWSFSKHPTKFNDEYTVNNSEYIGVGCGAFSHIKNQLFINAYDLNTYKDLVEKNSNTINAQSKIFSLKEYAQYQFLLQLFGGAFKITQFNESFHLSLEDILKVELFCLKKIKAIVVKEDIIYPTRLGEFLCVMMMKEFYMGIDNIRTMLRHMISMLGEV